MTGINGSAPKINLGLSVGVIALLVFGIIIGGFFIQETKNQTVQNQETVAALDTKITKRVDDLDQRVTDFIKKWEKRIAISNKVNNGTQLKLLGLQENASKIFQQQLENEKHILGNLTAHRHVANFTRDQILTLQNTTLQNQNILIEQEKQLLDLQNKTDTLTGPEYAKLADIRVKNIVGNLSADHKVLMEEHEDIMRLLAKNSSSSISK